ncbi:MAG: pyrroline-5-carboxylate reductase [Gammaproteobacteria bacterium]|nr:pyrroline-5-carboxylate reductase [Gammaproteobacteria bacterium]MCP5136403.1 pyrroline-5-carboxylate reductase [Gammaproteobacteria bacterium]
MTRLLPHTDQAIAFIGGGNMARSLIGGLIANGWAAENIWVADNNAQQLESLNSKFPVHTSEDNEKVAAAADVLVLSVKPQVLHAACQRLAAIVQARRPLVISIAAGVRQPDIMKWLGGNVDVVRAMPNTPALVQSGATALFAAEGLSKSRRALAESVMRAVGLTLWVRDEHLMDAVTALSGSGPAYIFLVIEAMEAAGVELGLDAETARLLALQTAFGAAKMALESSEVPATLRQRVTSPGGTTERALGVFEDAGLMALFERALTAARNRSRELADMLGQQ